MANNSSVKRSTWKRLYVSVLMFFLPLLLKFGNIVSKKIRKETTYLGNDFSFAVVIDNSPYKAVFKQVNGSWKNAKARVLRPQYTITFRDLDYAYDVFIGNLSLQDALAARLFTTRGPNNAGVSITYLFTVILKAFFGWRKAYQ